MQTTTYKVLCESREKFEKILTELGLKLEPNTWLYKAFSVVEKLSNIYTDEVSLGKFKKEENKNGEIYFYLSDLSLLEYILDFVKYENPNILKRKFQNILKMDFPPIENNTSNEARNTLWELLLLSHFKKANVNANLKDPNPDILIHLNSRNYCIECKRIYSPKLRALRGIVKDAIGQLEEALSIDSNNNSVGILALSIERPVTGNNTIFEFETEHAGRDELKAFIREFINENNNIWQGIVRDKKIVAIIIHMMVLNKIRQGDFFGNAFQVTLSNAWADESGFQPIANDLNSVLKILEQ